MQIQLLLQVVKATAATHGCSSVITWNPVAYIPVVNDAGMVAQAQNIAGQLAAVKKFDLLDRPTFMAEDMAFFNGKLAALSQSQSVMMLNWNVPVRVPAGYTLHCINCIALMHTRLSVLAFFGR